MKRLTIGLITLVAISLSGATIASAAGYGSYGRHYSGYSSGPSGYSGYGSRPLGYGGSRWHDTSHYDYHPTTIQRHGFHFHVVPGHYDYHRTGHQH